MRLRSFSVRKAPTVADLCEFEIQVLRELAGQIPAVTTWGAALGQAMEVLEGNGLIHHGSLLLTEKGKAWLSEKFPSV